MTTADIRTTIQDFADGARNAVRAGFDGVELHAASGVLLHQFLADGCNRRTDEYGGSKANRLRFVVEVVEAVADAIGPDRVGLRISPGTTFLGVEETDVREFYPMLARVVGDTGIVFLHVHELQNRSLVEAMRENWPATYIVNPHVEDRRAPSSLSEAQQVLADGTADLVAFGRLFISNPDLPYRFQAGLPLIEPDPETFYFGDHRGYTDYPTYREGT
jgi:N-ethylmaleimide reductase